MAGSTRRSPTCAPSSASRRRHAISLAAPPRGDFLRVMDPVSYEDYVGMCGCPPVMGIDAMLAHYRITMADWARIAGYWNAIIATNPQYMQHGLRVEHEAARIRMGGAPRAVTFGGAAPQPTASPVEEPMHAVSGAM